MLLRNGEKPIGVLDDPQRRITVDFLKRRYDRMVLPDSFAKRFKVSKVREALYRKRDSYGRALILLDPWDEVGEEEPYDVTLLIILRHSLRTLPPRARAQVDELLHTLLHHLVNAPHILVTGVPEWTKGTNPASHAQLSAAWETIVRYPEEISLAEIAPFQPFHAESLNPLEVANSSA
jgi:hypothetical protein